MSLRRVFSLTLAVSSLALSPLAFAPAAQAAVVKPLDVVSIKYDPPGRDYQTNAKGTVLERCSYKGGGVTASC